MHKIVTDLGVLSIEKGAFRLLERAKNVSIEKIQTKTAGPLVVEGEVGVIELANTL